MSPIIETGVRLVRATIRSQEIGYVMTRYLGAETVAALGIEVGWRALSFSGLAKHRFVAFDRVFGTRLAETFMRLGPTFIKLGQMLAVRPDLVGETISNELQILFNRVPSVPFPVIKRILERELGAEVVKRQIKTLHTRPIASASISQVHRAILADGKSVILKVQKPGVARKVRADLALLGAWVHSIQPFVSNFDLLQMFQDFKFATLNEIDFKQEAKNVRRFRRNFRSVFGKGEVIFPRVYPKLSGEKVLALEPMQGTQVQHLKKGSTVAKKAAALSIAAVLEQVFEHGFFHADPHSGNLFFMEDQGRVAFIDLGLVGQLNPKDKKRFLKVLLAILKKDRKNLAKALFDLGIPGKKTDFAQFEGGIQNLLDEVTQSGVKKIRLDKLVNRLFSIARKNAIHIPNRYVLMIRSFLIIEGVAKSLDPSISLLKVAPPIVARSLFKSYNPLNIFKKH